MIVADASLIVNFYLGEQELAMAILRRDHEWYTTPLWRFEVHNALLKYIRFRHLTVQVAQSIVNKAAFLTADRVREVSTSNALEAASTFELSAYDADYVALAKNLAAPLVTFDQKLIRATKGIALSPIDFLR